MQPGPRRATGNGTRQLQDLRDFNRNCEERNSCIRSLSTSTVSKYLLLPLRYLSASPGASCRGKILQFGYKTSYPSTSVTETVTSIPSNAAALPSYVPHSGTACSGFQATATRMRLRLPMMLLVGSKSIQPAPGR